MRGKKRRRPVRRKPSGLRSELSGLLLLVVAAFVALSLYSYDARDGDLFIHLAGGPARNLGGRVGATVAALGFQLVGIGAWLTVIVVASVGWRRLRCRKVVAPITKTLGSSTLLVFGTVLLHYARPTLILGGEATYSGGLLGLATASALTAAFGDVGGPMLALAVAAIATIAATKLSIAAVFVWIGGRLAAAWRHVVTAFARRSVSRRRKRQRREVVAKHAARRTTEQAAQVAADTADGPRISFKVPIVARRPGAPLPDAAALPGNGGRSEDGDPGALLNLLDSAPESSIDTPPMAEPEPETLPFEQPAGPGGNWAMPPSELLDGAAADRIVDREELMQKAGSITAKLAEFNVTGEVVAIHPGPVVTTFEFRPGPGVKYSRITNLEDDLSLALKAVTIRIARLGGKSTVGIEVPNNDRSTIRLREVCESRDFTKSPSKLTMAMGKQIHGTTVVADLARMPHLLIAGTTGSGKSVALNCMLLSLLYKASPDEVKLVLIDPKRLEFGLYEDIPHLLTSVVVEPKLAANALSWAVREMERRYKLLAEYGVRSIDQFNLILKRGGEEVVEDLGVSADDLKPLPYIVVIIDELADLMMTASAVVENAIIRLSQMARAVGIHLILATQRPSVDVITGVIKNNLPARISFRVASKVDSRVILDTQGAEVLLGKGDMLFLAPGTSRLSRIHGAYVDEAEVKRVVNFWRAQGRPAFESKVTAAPPEAAERASTHAEEAGRDEMYDDALQLVFAAGEASISNIQRKLRVGYARAGRIVDTMEIEGIVGPPEGSKPRRLLVDRAQIGF